MTMWVMHGLVEQLPQGAEQTARRCRPLDATELSSHNQVYTLPRREYGFVRMGLCHFLCWSCGVRRGAGFTRIHQTAEFCRNSRRIGQTTGG
ncbi:hypothetical protein [Leptolyngbya sp. O-77]|uniref:hypothetical protein n=1 Tax=Leptolyngbya sp. O-77 TaxID=1080068 RepID=UPI0012E3A517|nr:hypothetical protein [Leptolyngbya sp. O-77]